MYLLVNLCMERSIIALHPILLLLLLAVVYVVIFYCEGLKIAVVSSAHLTRDELLVRREWRVKCMLHALDWIGFSSFDSKKLRLRIEVHCSVF